MNNSMPVVLVHRFWHGGWCWSPVAEHLTARGIQPVAVDLDGHGLRGPAPRALDATVRRGEVRHRTITGRDRHRVLRDG